MRSLAGPGTERNQSKRRRSKQHHAIQQHSTIHSCEIYLCPHGSEFCLHLVETAHLLRMLRLNLPQLALTRAHLY